MPPDSLSTVCNVPDDLPPTVIANDRNGSHAGVTVFVPGQEPVRHDLICGTFILGQAEDCDIPVNADGVSRCHARLTIARSGWFVEDVGSTNGTTVGGQLTAGITRLWPGQEVAIGSARVRLQRAYGTAGPPGAEEARRLLPEERRLLRRYDIGSVVAQGGMGAVLDAHDGAMERKVAMKVMLDPGNPEALARFVAEARITGQLEHPNIVPIHDIGIDANGQVFYAMKFVRGVTLAEVFAQLAAKEHDAVGKFPLPVLLTVFQKVCDALAFAHSRGVLHRDLKPANIMLGNYGEVLVMDWGLAKLMDAANPSPAEAIAAGPISAGIRHGLAEGESSFGGTLTGTVMGTPQYMAPEQARGEIETLDARSDLYSLGAILFEVIHRRPPVSGTSAMEVVMRVSRGMIQWTAPGPRSEVPASLLAVCRKALALDPGDRYPRVEALQADLLSYQNGFATSAEQASVWKQFTLLIKRNKAASLGLAAVLLVGSVFGAGTVIQGRRAAAALDRLRGTAPTFVAQAQALVAEEKFDAALQKLGFALDLAPADATAHLVRGHIFQTQLDFAEAAASFEGILRRTGDAAILSDARANLALCERLRAASNGGEVKKETLRELHAALLAQHRTGEAAVLARHGLGRDELFLGYQQKIIGSYGESYRPYFTHLPDDTLRLYAYGQDTTHPIHDLRPLAGMPFSDINLKNHPVSDLTPLAGMPLGKLYIYGTKVRDLSPLHDAPLKELNLAFTEIGDLTPLKGMPLEYLDVAGCDKVRDLSPLKGMPLRTLLLTGTNVADFSPIRGMPLEHLDTVDLISDLRILQGLPLKGLRVIHHQLRDLSPLAGMPLEDLDIGLSQVADLTPLREMHLKRLNLHKLPVTDLRPLRGMPLEYLRLNESEVTDLSPLLDCPTLKEIILPPRASNVGVLRQLPQLERLSFRLGQAGDRPAQTAAEFWSEYDEAKAKPPE